MADEPIESNLKSYVAIAEVVKKTSPAILLIEACHSTNLKNMLSVWVPQLDYLSTNYAFFKARQLNHQQVWYYCSAYPQGEYANRFIELPLIKTRLLHWINYRYGITGYLHWGFNQWDSDNPLEETSFKSGDGASIIPGGDSWIIYPKNGKLYGSIRLETMRNGLNDYKLLKMLERRDAQLARKLCSRMVTGGNEYVADGNLLKKVRHEILLALSE